MIFDRNLSDCIDSLLREIGDGHLEKLRSVVARLYQKAETQDWAVGICCPEEGSPMIVTQLSKKAREYKIRVDMLIRALYEQVVASEC